MSIRIKLILGLAVTIVVAIAGISSVIFIQGHKNAQSVYTENAKCNLTLIDDRVRTFFEKASIDAHYMGNLTEIQQAMGTKLPSFLNGGGRMQAQDFSPEGLNLQRRVQEIQKINPAYSYIYIGFEADGTIVSAPNLDLKTSYDPRQRPWYTQVLGATAPYSLTPAYIDAFTGEPTSTIAVEVKQQGQRIAVVGIDINLSSLSTLLNELKIGQTGYCMLVEPSGNILASPKNPEWFFKNVQELNIPALQRLQETTEGSFEGNLNGQDVLLSVHTGFRGYKTVSIIDADEVYAGSDQLLLQVLLYGAALLAFLLLFAWLFARSITQPIQSLIKASEDIGQGNFNALPPANRFSGELLVLHTSLKTMLEQLSALVEDARLKSEEAAIQTQKATEASSQAQEAQHAAERAKREGMLAAATQLDEAVSVISSAAAELSAQIEQSRIGAAEQAHRVAETATAMQQMNATVMEVARNTAEASETATATREKAEMGAQVVQHAVDSIQSVQQQSLQLKEDMSTLNEHAKAISQIMGVISDIADQTNLLALNAAIEAARAGEAGRGFAVVADEVRKLAEKTMASTSEVGKAISAIQHSTTQSMQQVDASARSIEEATGYVNESGAALQEIVSMVDVSADQVRAIATASEEQSASSEEIHNSIDQVNRIAQETDAAMQESSSAISELSSQAIMLQHLIEDLKRDE